MGKRAMLLAGACVMTALLGTIEVLPATAGARGQAATHRVIVVLKNQLPGVPASAADVGARRAAEARTQGPLESQLRASGAKRVHGYTLVNALAATVSSSEAARLRSNPAVAAVLPDQIIHLAPGFDVTSGATGSDQGGVAAKEVCAAGDSVQLNPQALGLIHADSQNPAAPTARKLGIDGSGVKVAFIADGLDINNPDFIRPNGQHVFVDFKDFSGEGTDVPTGGEEAFGDASSIAAQGREVYNVAGYGPHAVTHPCRIRIEGVAPGASLVGLTIFGSGDAGFNSSFMQAIDYAVSVDHVNVLNESLGNNYYPDLGATLDLIKATNDAAVAAGTTVTASSGDAGVTSTVGTPSTDPLVISAAASTSYRIDLQDGYGGAQFPGIRGYLSNDISSFSSGGWEQDGRTVDVTAPGELNWALCSTNVARYFDCFNYAGQPTPLIAFGGTSESAPLTAGVAALVIQAYAKTHGGAVPSPGVVKQIIVSTADDIGSPAEQQGAGLVDAYKAVLAAESYASAATAPATDSTLINSPTQLNAIGAPGTSETLTDTITNNGAATQKLSLSSRALGAYQRVAQGTTVTLGPSSPKTTDWQGVESNYEPISFEVPAGQARLNVSLAFQNSSPSNLAARVRLTLIDPDGNLAGYSVPQGNGNFGNIQVTNPRGGKWTGFIWSRIPAVGGTAGPVLYGASVARWTRFGTVTPDHLTLAPGESRSVALSVSTPASPGDSAGAIVIRTDRGPHFARQSSIAVTLRSLIPTGPESFPGLLTGGNGRSVITGQTFYYQMDVPAGLPELNAYVKLAENPNNPFTAFLINPDGQAVAQGANEIPIATAPGRENQLGAQLHVLSPRAGRWTLIIAFIPAVSGTALSEPFTVSTDESAVPVSAPTLPNSSSVQLAAGSPQTYEVRVTNTGPSAAAYFIDPRLASTAQYSLVALNTADTTAPLKVFKPIPIYLVPSHTTAFTATASTTGSTPIEFDASAPAGDPDIGSTVGSSVSASFAANPIAPGVWGVAPTVAGAFGVRGAPEEPVHTAMSVTTNAFDPTVGAATGDMWQIAVNPATPFAPVIIGPGQTATIQVTITPQGPSGTADSGTVYVDQADLFLFQNFLSLDGSQVAAIPYSYTVK